MAGPELMRDGLGPAAVGRITSALAVVCPMFDTDRFRAAALDGLAELELKARVDHLIAALHTELPADFKAAAAVLERVPDCWDAGAPDDPLRGFAAWPITDYIGVYGVDEPHPALQTLKRLTPLFSAEFAIRPFILQHPELVCSTLATWCDDDDRHVRRLVSEGTRPRLPWGCRLPLFIRDPAPILPLLERLRDDPSEYVRRSVANNLNDIAKDHPETTLDVCTRWAGNAPAPRQKLIRHALRTLVKAGHPRTFPLLGYTAAPRIAVADLAVTPTTVQLGDTIAIAFDLVSEAAAAQSMVVDYRIHFVKANGRTAPKVFKLRNVQLPGRARQPLTASRSFAPISTRRYYPGRHELEILVNGQAAASTTFNLIERR
jgi:3-methyladenine DNA glycosylase AlkC